jgi:hypothetical protein
LIAGEQQCGAAHPVAFDFDAFVVMNGGPWIQYLGRPEPSDPLKRLLGIAMLPKCRASTVEALLPSPIGVGRFVIRATHERGVGVPPSRSLATASHEANSLGAAEIAATVGGPLAFLPQD